MQQPTGFKELLNKMMSRRWYITAMVLGGFLAGFLTILYLVNINLMSELWLKSFKLKLSGFLRV